MNKQTLRDEATRIQSRIDAVRAKLAEVNARLDALLTRNADDSDEGEILAGTAEGLELRLQRLFQQLDAVHAEMLGEVETDL